MVTRVRWVLWGRDWRDWDHQWDQLGAMGPGLGMVNRIRWVLWGRDGGGWDPQWDQLGAVGLRRGRR